jgi:TatD DNase family protein
VTDDSGARPDPAGDLVTGPPVGDSHCHLADEAFSVDLDAVVARAVRAGLTSAVCILSADEDDELSRADRVRLAWPAVRFAAGVHPHRAAAYAGRAVEAARVAASAATRFDAVAIGEIGLDYHYDFAPRAVQWDVFAAQVAVAAELRRPVVIHTREAAADTLAVLREGDASARGVMHCFTGTRDEARQALDLGFFVSLSGILTFPRAETLRDVATFIPPDRLLVETDAPFLAPVPYRGRRNEPAWLQRTVAALAQARGESLAGLARQIARNFAVFVGASPPD